MRLNVSPQATFGPCFISLQRMVLEKGANIIKSAIFCNFHVEPVTLSQVQGHQSSHAFEVPPTGYTWATFHNSDSSLQENHHIIAYTS